MAYLQRFVDNVGGSDANDGTTKALRKKTLTSMEGALSAATRYSVNIYPGTYRETVTCAVSGPAPYTTGTVSVTNGSKTVTGSGTSWLTNAQLNDYFQVLQFAHGTDGSFDGTTSTFTSAAGNFQAGHTGMTIRVDTKTAGIITFVSATQVTVANVAGVAIIPTVGAGLTYDVGPSGPIKIASVDSDTQITLAANWDFPTLTGLAYQVWGHIEYIGDFGGTLTDNVGGVVRVTGSDNDQAATRANCITATSKNQRTFSGFLLDLTSNLLINLATSYSNWVISGCVGYAFTNSTLISASGTGGGFTAQGCLLFVHPSSSGIAFTNGTVLSNMAGIVQNCIIFAGQNAVLSTRVGGILVRNCAFPFNRGSSAIVFVSAALTVGQALTVNNCVMQHSLAGFGATVVGEIQEDYNDLASVTTNYTNTTAGSHTVTYPPLFDSRWFFQLLTAGAGPNSALQVVSPFDLSAASQLVNLAGRFPTLTDLRGTAVQGAAREFGATEYDSTLKTQGGAPFAVQLIAGASSGRASSY